VRPESMDVPHFQHPELFKWVFDDQVLDLVEPILGPDLALFSTHFICKPQGNGKRVPWHEDSAYWRGMLDIMEVVTVWLSIDPSKIENGCMYVVPRSHNTGKKGFSDYDDIAKEAAVFPTEITMTQRNDAAAVAIELEANRCSLHDGRLIHGSPPNTSSLRRCGYTMRFISTRSRLNREDFPWHQIYLARGKDHAGNVYADHTKAYPEMARFRAKHGKNGH
jgi:ectoine hydroxylase-related dioxygenase (phytanoyl-CoA dioxygenase family)